MTEFPPIDRSPGADPAPLPLLICTVGLPRSGKTTWALSTGLPVVCPDAIRLAVHGRRFHAPAEPFVWATAKLMVRALFNAGHPAVVLDATNASGKRRREWVDGAWRTEFKVFDTPPDECLRRLQASGDPEYISELVPVVMRMQQEMESLAPWERPFAGLDGRGCAASDAK